MGKYKDASSRMEGERQESLPAFCGRMKERAGERGMMGWKEREGHLGGWKAINKANEMTVL